MTPPSDRRSTRLVSILCSTIALTTIALTTAACGGSSSGSAPAVATLAPAGTTSSGSAAPGAEGASKTASSGPTEADFEQAAAQYKKCMSDAGFEASISIGDDAPSNSVTSNTVDPQKDSSNFDPEAYDAADKECSSALDNALGGDIEMSPEDQAKMDDLMLEYQKCMKEQGVEVNISGNQITPAFGSTMPSTPEEQAKYDAQNDEYMKADEVCSAGLNALAPGGTAP